MDKNESISSLLSISMIAAISTGLIQVKQQFCRKSDNTKRRVYF
jgi:hypothetical protein